MTVRNCLVFAFIAGVMGAFIGRAMPRDVSNIQAVPSASFTPSAAAPAGLNCKAERKNIESFKAQLATCMANGAPAPETEAENVPELSESELQDPHLPSTEERREYRRRLDSYPEAVIVRHHDGTTGVYAPDEWPIDGDGTIVARKLSSGELAWYAGPDAGPRSDPAAFRTSDPPNISLPALKREPDGTITINGKPASSGVQFMFGGKVDKAAKPSPGDDP